METLFDQRDVLKPWIELAQFCGGDRRTTALNRTEILPTMYPVHIINHVPGCAHKVAVVEDRHPATVLCGRALETILRAFLTVVMAGFAFAGIILGYGVIAGNGDEPAVPQKPETATPSPEEKEGYWTPERLKEAKPLEMPYAPWPPTSSSAPAVQFIRREPPYGAAGSGGGLKSLGKSTRGPSF